MECNFENCGYYTDGECNICGMGTDGEDTFCKYCKDNPNCYYKQLKRLEQANQELTEDNLNLSKENERLQKLTCFNCGEETLSPSGAEIYNKILVYKQTLQEIKVIAENSCCMTDDVLCNKTNCYDCKSVWDSDAIKRILQKITKAEEE